MTAYVIAEIDVRDAAAYEAYKAAAPAAIARYGGRYISRGGATYSLEGAAPKRIVVVAFDDMDAARRCYESAEYGEIRKLRQKASDGRVFIVDGV
jgi:uncharacterized protein (DUF1330 family)